VAPALRSFIIHKRKDAADILEFLFSIHVNLRELTLAFCYLGKDSTSLLANVKDRYPDLEVLSLEGSCRLTSDGYDLIPHLKKLSELKLPVCKVDYIYMKPLETHVCIREHM
jgi:hypothetical protein